MFYDNLLNLCKEKHISLTHLVTKEIKMSVSNVTKWKEGKVPKSDTVQKIANYFGVSVDYLLGNEQFDKKEKSPATKAEDKVPDDFILLARKTESIPPEKRKQLYMFLNSTIDTFLEALKDEKGNKPK